MDLSVIEDIKFADALFNQSPQDIQNQQKPRQNLIQKYNHKGMNSLYYLHPMSQSIYLLDFKQQKFVKEPVKSQLSLPSSFSTCQLQEGNIFIVGGIMNEKASARTLELKEDLTM